MKPFLAAEISAFAAAARRARLSVEPCLVIARRDGETLAASSCVMRLDTETGPLYLFPRADIAADLEETGRLTRDGARVWALRLPCGGRAPAAVSALVGGAADRLAFDPRLVELVVRPAGGREACRML